MPIRLSGMSSGLDTESLVSALVSGYKTKKDDLVKAQTKLSWKQEKWKTTNSKIYSFYSGKLSSSRFSSAYSGKKASISNSSFATVTASSSAVIGTQSLKVKKLATTGYLTGGKISAADSDNTLSTSSKLSEISGFSGAGSISVTTGNTTKTIDVDGDTTISQFVNKLKDAGVNASFDANNKRFFISAKKSGAENDFSLTASNEGGKNALSALGLQATTVDSLSADMSHYQAIVNDANYVETTAKKNYNNTLTQYNKDIENYKKSNATLTDENTKLGYKSNYIDDFVIKAFGTSDFSSAVGTPTDDNLTAAKEYLTSQIDSLKNQIDNETNEDTKKQLQLQHDAAKEVMNELGSKSADDLKRTSTTADDGTVTYSSASDDLKKKTTDKIAENTTKISDNTAAIEKCYTDAGVDKSDSAYVDQTTGKFVIDADGNFAFDYQKSLDASTSSDQTIAQKYKDAAQTEKDYAQSMVDAYATVQSYGTSGSSVTESQYNQALATLGVSTSSGADAAVRIVGSDSEIELNGATFTNNTNAFNINGLTIQATALTGDEAVSITTDTDVDGIYDSIKDMFSEYNELIKSLDTMYNASSSKGYEPLTSDQKDEMSDKEVEEWEKKIKDSLLRNDSTLNGVISSMKSAMLSSFDINGKSYSLATFGISTGSYFSSGANEKGVFHIDGDSEDSTTSGNADKLKAMIASDPDAVVSFFTQLSSKVYDALGKKMGSTSMSSIYTVYNDKEMATQYSSYTSKISEAADKVSSWEDYYYKKFSRMESALAALNAQSSSMSGLFG